MKITKNLIESEKERDRRMECKKARKTNLRKNIKFKKKKNVNLAELPMFRPRTVYTDRLETVLLITFISLQYLKLTT